VVKVGFLNKKIVTEIPYSLKLAKRNQVKRILGFLDALIPGFINPEMLL